MDTTIRVLATELRFPDGPEFDASGNIWCVENEGEGLFCRSTDGSQQRVHTGGHPNGLICHEGNLWFCDSDTNAIRRMNLRTQTIETVFSDASGHPTGSPKELLFDDAGNLLVTCSGLNGQQGYIAVYSASGTVEIVADGLFYPNGIAFLDDRETLLIAETNQQRIWSGVWNPDETSWETIRVWAMLPYTNADSGIGPGGMAVGPDGNLYVAIIGAGIVRVYSADGQRVRDIQMPGKNPSNCAFDSWSGLGLVVTETEKGELISVSI